MKYNTTKRKLQKTFEQQVSNDRKIENKENTFEKPVIENKVLKAPQILYDSSWLPVPESEGNLFIPPLGMSTTDFSAKKGELLGAEVSFLFSERLEIEQNLIPFVKPIIMYKPSPDAEVQMNFEAKQFRYDTRNFFKVTGDGGLIYEGYKAGSDLFFFPDVDNFPLANTSKWFVGDIKWTRSGDTWEILDGTLIRARTYLNVVANAFGGHDWDLFDTLTFDNVSGSTVTGQGTNLNSEQVDDGGGGSFQQLTTTKCVDETMTLFQQITWVDVRGFARKNGISQGFGTWSVRTGAGTTLDGDPSIGAGNPFIQPGPDVVTEFEFEWNDSYKLHYTTKRVRQLNILTSTFTLAGLPQIDDCDTDPRIISQFKLEINPEGYPVVIQELIGDPDFKVIEEVTELDTPDTILRTSSHDLTWNKEPPETTNQFRFKIRGTIVVSIPATEPFAHSFDFVEETYSQTATGYTRDAENRDDKELDVYTPLLNESQFRLQMVVVNPLVHDEIKRFEKEDRL